MNYVYIKKSVRGFYLTLPEKLNSSEYNLGETYKDFLENKFVLLSKKQVKFHEDNPNASIEEVLAMELRAPHIRTIEEAKSEMISNIHRYDNGDDVNSFTINNAISSWLTSQERANYKNSIDSAKLLGVETLSFYINDMELNVPTVQAEKMLAAIQLYADACFIVTKKHLAAVEALETIEEVDDYDYKVGYPEKLNFEL